MANYKPPHTFSPFFISMMHTIFSLRDLEMAEYVTSKLSFNISAQNIRHSNISPYSLATPFLHRFWAKHSKEQKWFTLWILLALTVHVLEIINLISDHSKLYKEQNNANLTGSWETLNGKILKSCLVRGRPVKLSKKMVFELACMGLQEVIGWES